MNILIVDDEEGLRFGLKRFFEREGFSVYATEDYMEALRLTEEFQISIALLDIRLKGRGDGISLLEDLLKIDQELVPIMITGHGSISNSVEAMKKGALDYILKPIDNNSLMDIIRKNLELKNLRNENQFLKNELRNNIFPYDFITYNTGNYSGTILELRGNGRNKGGSLNSRNNRIKNIPILFSRS